MQIRSHHRATDELEEVRTSFAKLRAEHTALQESYRKQTQQLAALGQEAASLRALMSTVPTGAGMAVNGPYRGLPPIDVGGGPAFSGRPAAVEGHAQDIHKSPSHGSLLNARNAHTLARMAEEEVHRRQVHAIRSMDHLKHFYDTELFSCELEALTQRQSAARSAY